MIEEKIREEKEGRGSQEGRRKWKEEIKKEDGELTFRNGRSELDIALSLP